MKTHNRSNALLMELLIVILVFMLASTLLMQAFAKVHMLEDKAQLTALSLAEAQDHADRLYAADDPEEALRNMGYTKNGSDWIFEREDYISSVTLNAGENGLTHQELTIRDAAGEVLITLACSRWREVSP